MLTQDELKEYLSYDSETGNFTWIKTNSNRAIKGKIAGTFDKDKYVNIAFNKKRYKAHRLAWFYVYNIWPKNHIDHEDGNPSNNKLSNLRDATQAENCQNIKKANIDSKTGVLGVTIKKGRIKNPYKAQIRFKSKNLNLGHYPTIELAHIAYLNKKREIHPFSTI